MMHWKSPPSEHNLELKIRKNVRSISIMGYENLKMNVIFLSLPNPFITIFTYLGLIINQLNIKRYIITKFLKT